MAPKITLEDVCTVAGWNGEKNNGGGWKRRPGTFNGPG